MILNKDDKETVTVRTEKKIKRKRDEGGVHVVTEAEEKIYSLVSKAKTVRQQQLCTVRLHYIIKKKSGAGFVPELPDGNQNLGLAP